MSAPDRVDKAFSVLYLRTVCCLPSHCLIDFQQVRVGPSILVKMKLLGFICWNGLLGIASCLTIFSPPFFRVSPFGMRKSLDLGIRRPSENIKRAISADDWKNSISQRHSFGHGAWLKFLQKIGDTDKYKEDGRLSRNRKTVFSPHDWTHFRRSGRVFWNLMTMFRSGIIKGLWLEIGSVTLVALIVFLANLLIRTGALRPLLPPTAMLALPAMPFQLTSPALGLLLVFRTNTVNTRWRQARMAWERIESVCCSVARQGMAYLELADKEEHARRVVALAHACRAQFRPGAAGEEGLRASLARLLGPSEAARVMAAPSRPTQAESRPPSAPPIPPAPPPPPPPPPPPAHKHARTHDALPHSHDARAHAHKHR